MKRLLTLIFILPCIHSVYAQEMYDYCPMVEEGKRWTYDDYMDFRPDQYNHYYWYYFEGDTVIDGRRCLKMYAENEYNDGKVSYMGAFYEENKKVYRILKEDTPVLIYDFDCKEGDVIKVAEGMLTVERIFTEQNADRTLRILELSSEEASDLHFYWIEGVGCMQDFFQMIPLPGNNRSLARCELKDEVLYQYVQPKFTEDGYHEMAIEGKTWNYIHHYEDGSGVHEEPYSYVVRGDTVIGRTVCKKLYYKDSDTEQLAYILSEKGRDLYTLLPGSSVWTNPYQFGRADYGRIFDWDSKQGTGRVYWMLHDTDTITVNGTDFRRLTFYSKTIDGGTAGMISTIEDGSDVWHEIWIEGVGSELTGIETPVHEKPLDAKEYTRFVSCYENGLCIFTAKDFVTRSLTSTTASPMVNGKWSNSKWSNGQCFDLAGRRLAAPPAKGVYIKDGKKMAR